MYISPYDAYPFLRDAADDLRCDFELETDGLACELAALAAMCPEPRLRGELLRVSELVYHVNPALRTGMRVTREEIDWLAERMDELREALGGRRARFVLPQGSPRACAAHRARVSAKRLVRLLYRHAEQGHPVDGAVFDFCNLLSGYCFHLALNFNALDGVDEVTFVSRNY